MDDTDDDDDDISDNDDGKYDDDNDESTQLQQEESDFDDADDDDDDNDGDVNDEEATQLQVVDDEALQQNGSGVDNTGYGSGADTEGQEEEDDHTYEDGYIRTSKLIPELIQSLPRMSNVDPNQVEMATFKDCRKGRDIILLSYEAVFIKIGFRTNSLSD